MKGGKKKKKKKKKLLITANFRSLCIGRGGGSCHTGHIQFTGYNHHLKICKVSYS